MNVFLAFTGFIEYGTFARIADPAALLILMAYFIHYLKK